MKICKNCGRQTDDSKVRCPYCGYLFEADMDSVLRKMKENLNTYKDSVASSSAPQPQSPAAQPSAPAPQAAQPAAPVQPVAPAPQAVQYVQQPVHQAAGYVPAQDNSKAQYELLTEVAQLKGELRALHTELDRRNANQQYMQQPAVQYVQQPVQQSVAPAQQPAQYVQPQPVQYVQQPAQPQTVIYANSPYPAQQSAPTYMQTGNGGVAAYGKGVNASGKAKRSSNRIVLSVLSLLLLALSIGMFFLPWVIWEKDLSFDGFGGVMYIFTRDGEGAFASYLAAIQAHEFVGTEMIANVCRYACLYIVEYGVIVYAAFLVLGFPLLFSMFGKISCKGWHRFVAWMSFIVSLILFGVFVWVSGFSAVTVWFMVGAGANLVRCLFLAFYRGKKRKFSGLE